MRRLSHRIKTMAFLLPGVLALGGCAVAPPTGPTVVAMPAKGKSFEQFRADDAVCRHFASAEIGGASPAQAANRSALGSAAVGTALGAAAGAAIGAATGNPAAGAAIGAGSGLALGTLGGLGAGEASAGSLQWRYDVAYLQCMSAKGESVPKLASGAYAYPTPYAYPSYSYSYSYYPGYAYYPGWSAPFYFDFDDGWHHWHHWRR